MVERAIDILLVQRRELTANKAMYEGNYRTHEEQAEINRELVEKCDKKIASINEAVKRLEKKDA